MQVGDKVFIGQYGSWHSNYVHGTVVKVTPTGLVDVLVGYGTVPTRFDKNGKEFGKERRWARFIDKTPIIEREALIAQENRTAFAVAAYLDVKVSRVTNFIDKESLLCLITGIETQVAEARKRAEAI